MAGLAVIDIAQKVSRTWRSLQAEWKCSNKSNSKHGKRAQEEKGPVYPARIEVVQVVVLVAFQKHLQVAI